MDKVILKTNNPAITELSRLTIRAGYEALQVCAVGDLPALCAADRDIHGVLIDSDLITPEQVRQILAAVQDELFPVILFAGAMSDAETGRWIGAGVSDILRMPMPAPLFARRISNVIRMYCVSRSLSSQAHDPLTGLLRRNSFYHYAREMMNADPAASYTIILSDIENFRLINERYGEEKGDELLRYVGGVLGGLNGENSLFARYGGDQFVGIIRCTDSGNGQDETPISEGIQRMYAEAPVRHFRVKFGIYDAVDQELPVSIMCDKAHMALKTVKHQYGRLLAKYSVQMQKRFDREQQILDSMEEALAEEQFQVYYQPKHDAKTSKIIGVEALARWIHPSYGFLSPGEFIPLFERSGFIAQLDMYVWNRVCRDMKGWLAEGRPAISVSVNASRMDLLEDCFLDAVDQPLAQYGLDADMFHLEITESIYMEDAELIKPILTEMHRRGIRIELDDFGSGFSSLGILTKLPLDIIKLDISLIRNLETQPLIVESIIKLMQTLGYRVIAEGVETDEQLEMLRQMGCDWIQGYYFSKPLTLNGLKEYVEQYETEG